MLTKAFQSVESMDQFATAECVAEPSNNGVVTMRAQVNITYLDGLSRTKRFLVNRRFHVSQEQAKRETDAMRKLNKELEIRSVYSVDL